MWNMITAMNHETPPTPPHVIVNRKRLKILIALNFEMAKAPI